MSLKRELRAYCSASAVAPLFRLTRVVEDLPAGVELYVKAEWFNPGRAVKDRPALRMIEEAKRDGRLTPDKIICLRF